MTEQNPKQSLQKDGEKSKLHAIKVNHDNAPLLAVKYLEQIFARLGYMIKLIEEKK